MTVALTLTPDIGAAAVLVEITGATGPVLITRSDANGTTPVRLKLGQVPISGALTVIDAEAALVGWVRYDVADGAAPLVSATTTLAGVTTPRLGPVTLPQLAVTLEAVTGFEDELSELVMPLDVIDSPRPIFAGVTSGRRTGTLEIFASSMANAAAVRSALARAPVLLRQPDHAGMDLYFRPTSVRITPDELVSSGWTFVVTVAYLAYVLPPTEPLIGTAGWTYADLTAAAASYTIARTMFATYADLTAGPWGSP